MRRYPAPEGWNRSTENISSGRLRKIGPTTSPSRTGVAVAAHHRLPLGESEPAGSLPAHRAQRLRHRGEGTEVGAGADDDLAPPGPQVP